MRRATRMLNLKGLDQECENRIAVMVTGTSCGFQFVSDMLLNSGDINSFCQNI